MSLKQQKPALYLMIIAILFVSLNLRPAITSVGPLLEIVRTDLGLSNGQVSLITSVPVFCMGLFASLAVPFNRLFGMKRSITVLLILLGTATAVRAFTPTFPVLLITAFLAGVAIAVISPLLSAKIKQDFPTRTAALIGVYSFGMGAGASLSAGLTGPVYEISSWPVALAVWALLAVAAIFVWERVKEPAAAKMPVEVTGVPVVSPWRNPRAYLMLLFFGFQASLFFAVTTWLPAIAIEKGMSVIEGGTVLTVMSIVQIIFNLTIPVLLEKFPNRLLALLGILVLGAAGTAMLLSEAVSLIWPAAILLGIALGGLFPIALLMPLDETDTAEDANSWTAMIQSGGFLMAGIAPLAIGLLVDRFGNHSITVMLFLALIAGMAVCALLLGNRRQQA